MRVTGLFWESIVNLYRDSLVHDLLSYFSERYFSVDFHLYEHIPIGPSLNGSAEMIIVAVMLGLIFASVIMAVSKARYGRFVSKLLKEDCMSPQKSKTLSELGEFRNSWVRRSLTRGTALARCVYCIRRPELLEEAVASLKAAKEANEQEEPTVSKEESDDSAEDAYFTREKTDAPAEEKEGAKDGKEEKIGTEMSVLRAKDALTGEERPDFTVARFYIPADLKYRAEIRFERRGSGWIPVVLTVILSIVGAALVCRFLPDFVQLLDNLISMMAPEA